MSRRATLQTIVEVSAATAQDPLHALDSQGWSEACVLIFFLKGCTSSTSKLSIETALEPAEDMFVEVAGASVSPLLTNYVGNAALYMTTFSRYLRWRVSGTLDQPVRFAIEVFFKRPDLA
jgi:hypothetical protein